MRPSFGFVRICVCKPIINAIKVPGHRVYRDRQSVPTAPDDKVVDAIWSLGGTNGWPTMNWAWKLRGGLDRILGGTGLRRGRRHPGELRAGDALDFWRVLLADRESGRLILYAGMKLPGEAWLEFSVHNGQLHQNATFRPQGLLGRLYCFRCFPPIGCSSRAWRGPLRQVLELAYLEGLTQNPAISLRRFSIISGFMDFNPKTSSDFDWPLS